MYMYTYTHKGVTIYIYIHVYTTPSILQQHLHIPVSEYSKIFGYAYIRQIYRKHNLYLRTKFLQRNIRNRNTGALFRSTFFQHISTLRDFMLSRNLVKT
jgi:hypothetical protein